MTCKLIPLTAVCLAVASMPAGAERVLYLDASDPGLNPEETWEDQTEKANNFTNHGAEWSGPDQAFLFGGPDPEGNVNVGDVDGPFDAYFELTGDDSDFDFETDGVAGQGGGTPFSVVAWVNLGVDEGDDFVNVLIQKGPERNQEWVIRPRAGGSNTELIFNDTGLQETGMYARSDQTPEEGWFLLTITHDGSGFASTDYADTVFYFNDAVVAQEEVSVIYNGFNLLDPIESDAPVRVGAGYQTTGSRFFEGKIGFVEVWNEVVDESYVIDRYNGGNPTRATAPPVEVLPVSPVAVSGVSILSFIGTAEEVYTIHHGDNITDLNSFTSFDYTVTGSGNTQHLFDREAGANRFYQIRN